MHLLENTPEAQAARAKVWALLEIKNFGALESYDWDSINFDLGLELLEGGGAHPEFWYYLGVLHAYFEEWGYSLQNSKIQKLLLAHGAEAFLANIWETTIQLEAKYPQAFTSNILLNLVDKLGRSDDFRFLHKLFMLGKNNPVFRQKLLSICYSDTNYLDALKNNTHKFKYMNLRNMDLDELPAEICNFEPTHTLHIVNSRVKNCPDFVLDMPDLKVFCFAGAPLEIDAEFLNRLAAKKPLIYAAWQLEDRARQAQLEAPVSLAQILQKINGLAADFLEELQAAPPETLPTMFDKACAWVPVLTHWLVYGFPNNTPKGYAHIDALNAYFQTPTHCLKSFGFEYYSYEDDLPV